VSDAPSEQGLQDPALMKRFYEKVDNSAGRSDCWPWIGATDGKGRGQFWINGRLVRAPRVAWSLHHNQTFPPDKLACHTCDNPNCVNPAHIFVGSMSENIADAVRKGRHKANPEYSGWQKHKTHCKRGHPLDGDNLYLQSNGKGRGCRICQRMHNENYRARKQAV
jgi:hypothetical protein